MTKISGVLQATKEVLEAIPYGVNSVWVHTDRSLMPQRKEIWASWNFIGRSDLGNDSVCVTYWLNRLQSLPANAPDVFVTLNPVTKPAADSVTRCLNLSHPIYSRKGSRAQSRLPEIQVSNLHNLKESSTCMKEW